MKWYSSRPFGEICKILDVLIIQDWERCCENAWLNDVAINIYRRECFIPRIVLKFF